MIFKQNNQKNKIKTVAKFEVIRQLKKPSFWISLFAIPTIMFGIWGLSFINNSQISKSEKLDPTKTYNIGLTDNYHIIDQKILKSDLAKHQNINLFIFPDKDSGLKSLQDKKIETYYFIPKEFSTLGKIDAYKAENPETTSFIPKLSAEPLDLILLASAKSNTVPANQIILTKSYSFNTININSDGNAEDAFAKMIGKAIIPGIVLFVFYFMIVIFGNRMLMAVVEEKENRVSEMILSAVSAKDLIIGKIIALILLGFIQISVFILPIIAIFIANLNNPMLKSFIAYLEFDPLIFFANIILLFFSYFIYTSFSVLVGSITSTARDASSYISIFIIGFMAPFFFLNSFLTNDPNQITYILTYFPLSAPIALMLRNAIGNLPLFEFILGLLELGILSLLTAVLAIRSFQKNAINFETKKINFKLQKLWK